MRGAIWQLLRYSADRRGGSETITWSALVNTTLAGHTNFTNVFGDVIAYARDWAVARYADDAGPGVASNYTNPSGDFRSVMTALKRRRVSATDAPASRRAGEREIEWRWCRISFCASALRKGSGSGEPTSAGAPVAPAIDFMLLRTR
jgi:hypothetical protein